MLRSKFVLIMSLTCLSLSCGDAVAPTSSPEEGAAEATAQASDGDSSEPTSLEVYPVGLSMPPDDQFSVQVTVLDEDGEPFETVPDGVEIVWTSTNDAVVSVQDGVLTSGELGEAVVTASAEDVGSADVEVDVRPANHGYLKFTHGDRTFTIEGEFAFDPDDPDRVWWNRSSWAITRYWVTNDEQYFVGRSRAEDGDLYGEVYLTLHGRVTDPSNHYHSGWSGYLGLNHELDAGYQEWYDIENLSMTVTAVTEDRMQGTFSFDLVDSGGLAGKATDGSFDVPIGPDSHGS